MDSKRTTGSSSEVSFDAFLREFLAALYERRAAIDSCIRSLQVLPRRVTQKHRAKVESKRLGRSEKDNHQDANCHSGAVGSGPHSQLN
jgi:hypothetical protein